MSDRAAAIAHARAALARAQRGEVPFRHWTFADILPPALCEAVRALPFAPPAIEDTQGRRETHNSTRIFCDAGNQGRFAACATLAATFQAPSVVATLESLCDTTLTGGFLRVEYCLDADGFWLEPHTDIGAKLFTLLIYLSADPGSEEWGTDLLAADGTLVARARALPNSGLIFIPGADTWHGFARRKIAGVRRTLIVNYVRPEWRSRHELAFPDQPVRAV
ncbi:MAG TPA: 2OG-Fe(II) oxygenase [Acetobacteraceae bacterium]|nr:2OG-Fe(II) oxygenase [Acetobacteraceae bacterium]